MDSGAGLTGLDCKHALCWWPELGRGYYPVSGAPYDAAYFDKYRSYSGATIGMRLNQARLYLVGRHWHGHVLDVGIGCGQFVESHPDASGYDVNPAGVEWLKGRGKWCDLYAQPVEAATFWDSLEHIDDMCAALAQVRRFAFVSIPIFDGPNHVLASKHYRKDEHYHYFTHSGFVRFMEAEGFVLRESNDMETVIGREGIGSFAFERIS